MKDFSPKIDKKDLLDLLKKNINENFYYKNNDINMLFSVLQNYSYIQILELIQTQKKKMGFAINEFVEKDEDVKAIIYEIVIKVNKRQTKKLEATRSILLYLLKTRLGTQYYSDDVVDAIIRRFASINIETIDTILKGAKSKLLLQNSNIDEEVLNKAISSVISDKDTELYRQLGIIAQDFQKESSSILEKENAENLMKDVWNIINKTDKKFNNNITIFSQNSIKIFKGVSALYATLKEKLGDDEFDEDIENVLRNIISKLGESTLKLFDSTQIQVIGKILDKIVDLDNNNEELFTKNEILKLINKAPSVLANTNVEKCESVIEILNDYIKQLDKQYKTKINIKTKNVLLSVGTLLQVSSQDLKFATSMLLGNKALQAVKDSESYSTNKDLKDIESARNQFSTILRNVRIQGLDLETNKAFLKNPTFLLNFKPAVIYPRIDDISKAVCRALKAPNSSCKDFDSRVKYLYRKGFDITKILNKDNILELCDKTVILSKKKASSKNTGYLETLDALTSNVSILSKLIDLKDIHKIISHNWLFMLQNPNELQDSIKDLAKKSKYDIDKFKQSINKFVNDAIALKVIKSDVSTKGGAKTRTKTKNVDDDTDIQLENKKDEINIDNFVFDEEFMKDLGFEKQIETTLKPNEILKQIEAELNDIDAYCTKQTLTTSSSLMSKIVKKLNNEKLNDKEVKDFQMYAIIGNLQKHIKIYSRVAKPENVDDLLVRLEKTVLKIKDLRDEIENNIQNYTDLVKPSYKDFHNGKKQKENISSKKLKDLKSLAKNYPHLFDTLGVKIPLDLLENEMKKASINENNKNEERKLVKDYSNSLDNHKVVLKVLKKLQKMFDDNINKIYDIMEMFLSTSIGKNNSVIQKRVYSKKIKELEESRSSITDTVAEQ